MSSCARPALPFDQASRTPFGVGALEGGLIGWRQIAQPPPVVVAGGGMAGCLAAIYLARRGERVSVFEYRGDPRLEGKSAGRSINLTLTTRGLTALEKVGLRGAVEERGVRLTGRVVHNQGTNPTYTAYGPDPDKHYLLSVPRPELNKCLLDGCEAEPNATLHFGHKLLNVELPSLPVQQQQQQQQQQQGIDDSVVQPRLVFRSSSADRGTEAPSKTTSTTVAKAVIGADGMYSAVRAAIQRKLPRFDFSQNFISAGYKELTIPANPSGVGDSRWRLSKNALHLWPRGKFMMIAQPNHDGSFSCTLFMPFEQKDSPAGSFDMLHTEEQVLQFFRAQFNDAIPLLPNLLQEWFANPTSPLCTVRCNPFNYAGAAVLIGDAAHAIVPFYGQGCNSAFEDVRLLDQLWQEHGGNTARVFDQFSRQRKTHVDAIADLAIEHYHELANKVVRPLPQRVQLKVQAAVENSRLFQLCSPGYTSLYHAVSFSHLGYAEAQRKGVESEVWLQQVASAILVCGVAVCISVLAQITSVLVNGVSAM